MKNLFIILSCILVLTNFQCEERFEYDGSEKYRVYGYVSDENGEPISGLTVSVNKVRFDFNDIESPTQECITDHNGYYECIFTGANTKLRILQFNGAMKGFNWSKIPVDSSYQIKELKITCDDFDNYEMEINTSILPSTELKLINSSDVWIFLSYFHEGRIDLDSTLLEDNFELNTETPHSLFPPSNSTVQLSYYSNSTNGDTTLFIGENLVEYDLE